MKLSFCSLSSGSSGNCYLIKTEETAILIDAGVSAKAIKEGLDKTKTNLEMLQGVLITHEHTDHTKGLKVLLKREQHIMTYANAKTWEKIDCESERVKHFVTGEEFWVRELLVKPFKINHDAADPVGYSIEYQGKRITVVTDTGCIDNSIFLELVKADILILEANHDVDKLKNGKYPPHLKERVLGDRGHLSNEETGRTLCRIMEVDNKPRIVLLAHLSKDNNHPEIAKQTVSNILEESGIIVGEDLHVDTILRNEIGNIYKI